MMDEDFKNHVMEELRNIRHKQIEHREEFLREITAINENRKFSAKVANAIWGFITAAFALCVNWLFNHFEK